jgi:hypothetical protein
LGFTCPAYFRYSASFSRCFVGVTWTEMAAIMAQASSTGTR